MNLSARLRTSAGRLGDFVGTQAIVEDAQFEAHARQIRIDQQHALQRRDGALEIARLAGQRRKLEQNVEVGGLEQHFLERRIVLAFEIATRGRHRGRCSRRLSLRKCDFARQQSGKASCQGKNSSNQFDWDQYGNAPLLSQDTGLTPGSTMAQGMC